MTVAGSKTNWEELAATSHYRTAAAIADELAEGNVDEAATGLQELMEAVARSERRALRSQLIRLMVHLIKWLMQPGRRSGSWAATIYQAREEIAAIQEEVPSLTREAIEEMWEYCFTAAKRQAQAEMNQETQLEGISWQQAFEDEYLSPKTGKKRARGTTKPRRKRRIE
jgi:hypothetical protein